MALRKLTLNFDEKKDKWQLKDDKTKNVLKTFDKKEDATKGGVLEKVLGPGGGSVKIKKVDETYQEERTYPGKADPRRSKG